MPDPRPSDNAVTPMDAPGRVQRDIAEVTALTATGIEVDGEIQIAESTWAIYGRTTYDGEVIVGEYQDATEAAEVFRAVVGRTAGDDPPIS